MAYLDKTGLAYLWGKITAYVDNHSGSVELSHVGMVIHSTTMSTMQDVIDFYGGTTWIQHSGYFLQGAASGVTAGAAGQHSDGGEATVTLTADQSGLPAHGHGFTQPDITTSVTYASTAGTGTARNHIATSGTKVNNRFVTATASGGAVQDNQGADAAEAHNNVPPYKNVYIWERTA